MLQILVQILVPMGLPKQIGTGITSRFQLLLDKSKPYIFPQTTCTCMTLIDPGGFESEFQPTI